METKEQLKKKHAEWTVKEMDAKKRLDNLLPSVDLSEGVEPLSFNITDLLAKYKKILEAEEELKTASTKMQEIMEKLAQLR